MELGLHDLRPDLGAVFYNDMRPPPQLELICTLADSLVIPPVVHHGVLPHLVHLVRSNLIQRVVLAQSRIKSGT